MLRAISPQGLASRPASLGHIQPGIKQAGDDANHGEDVGLGAVEQVDAEEVAGQDGLGLGAQEL